MNSKRRIERIERLRQVGKVALLVVFPGDNGTYANHAATYTQAELAELSKRQFVIVMDM